MSKNQLIISIVAVIVVLAGLWFVWQRGSTAEERALERDIQAETDAMDADMADLEARLSR